MGNDQLRKLYEVSFTIERTQPLGAGGTSAVQRAAVVVKNQPITPDLYKQIHDLVKSQAPQGDFHILSISEYRAGTVFILD